MAGDGRLRVVDEFESRPSAAVGRLFRAYPTKAATVVLLTLISGLSEAVGVVALLPLLGLATGVEASGLPEMAEHVDRVLGVVGLEPSVPVLLGVIVAGITGKAALKVLALRQAGYAAAQVAQDLRLDLIEGLMTARWRYFTNQPIGSLANAVSSEALRASQVFTKATDVIAKLIQVLLYAAIAFLVSWQIALITLVIGAVMVASLRSLVAIARRAGQDQTRVMKSLITRLSDGLYAIKPLKAMGREGSLRPLLESETRELNGAQRRLVLSNAVLRNSHEVFIAGFVAAIVFVLFELLGFAFTEILFVAFLFHRTSTYLGNLQTQYQGLMECESAYWSIQQAVDRASEERERLAEGVVPSLEHQIRFEEVRFEHVERPVLDRCTFELPAGALTAIIGPSGVGKTTIADLVAGLHEPSSGEIYLDEVPLRQVDVHAWRERIGYVPQELVLFHDTIFNNVALASDDLTRQDVEAVLRDAGAWEFVSALPDGLDEVVGEHGMRLSGGQRQRLSIARALARRPELLILDEATTALDPETERGILDTLRELSGRVTILAISHQPTIVDAADHVIRLEEGPAGARVRLEGSVH